MNASPLFRRLRHHSGPLSHPGEPSAPDASAVPSSASSTARAARHNLGVHTTKRAPPRAQACHCVKEGRRRKEGNRLASSGASARKTSPAPVNVLGRKLNAFRFVLAQSFDARPRALREGGKGVGGGDSECGRWTHGGTGKRYLLLINS